jgi:glycosyltransferase involved in cell wall biosynthesis
MNPIGYFAPMPPAKSGVADYAATLLTELRTLGQVRLNDRQAPTALYHLGNNHLHREIYRRALERPGVVVLHDAVLHHFFLGSLTESDYVSEFVYNYGKWHADLARRLWRNRARSAADPHYFEYPMLRRIVEMSKAVIVHNRAALSLAEAHRAAGRIVEIPHLFVAPPAPPAYDIERLRQSLGVPRPVFLFGIFGYLRESKRLASVLCAFDNARQAGAKIALLVAGPFASSDLERAVAPLLQKPGIVRAGYLAEHDFWRYASAVDACINLRYPAAGETSGIAVRLMGIGKPVLVTAGEETAAIPDASCLRVDPGLAETEMLAEYMIWLSRFPRDAREIGDRAAAHIAARHGLSRVAAEYWKVLSGANGL